MDTIYNGRVDIMNTNNLTRHKLFDDDNENSYNYTEDAIKHIHSENPVASLFFSEHNTNILQDGIRYSVFSQTTPNKIIEKQSKNELLIIMRSIYLQYSRNLPTNVVDQVRTLNTRVIDYAVPTILREMTQFTNYKNDISKLPIPLEQPQNVSTKGTAVLFTKEL
tara:strand:+ start:275 stop:769 length:495 start_codon:yes stop_codon:yes gene_type:complete